MQQSSANYESESVFHIHHIHPTLHHVINVFGQFRGTLGGESFSKDKEIKEARHDGQSVELIFSRNPSISEAVATCTERAGNFAEK